MTGDYDDPPLSAAEIVSLGRRFMDAKVLLVAVKLRLFDELQKGR